MKLIHKFFLAFFITNITLVGLMFVFIYMNFASEFNNFVEKEEQQHLANVKQQLTKVYSQYNSWQGISQSVHLWRSIVAPKSKPGKSAPKSNTANNPVKPIPSLLWINLPADLLKTGQRISLYNADKHVVVGKPQIADNPHIEPIVINKITVGWLGLMPSRLVENSPAKAFLTAQFHNYFMITLLVILLAFVMAILLSRHLTKPIKQIVHGTNQLNKGNFTNRITPLTRDELGILTNNVNELANTLEHNQQMRFQWMSDTSHELKTPITVLRSHLLAVQDGVFEADEKRINLLIEQVDNLNHIVDDLAQLVNNDTANLTYHFIKLDLTDTVKLALQSFSARFKERSLTLNNESVIAAPQYYINADKDRLIQLFTNLLENTCRYTHAAGQVNITISKNRKRKEVTLCIQDSAPGVKTEELNKLFERFYRVEKSRNREFGGSGLGLALCQQIVLAHNGDITLGHSELGGLKAKITLPLFE
ncbi:ATP-binding protein [Pseudoalteromonas carrageenovora]|uniref:ATP-binding protein n=1 Tax=Pseudoalteromonas carrageenovora TaxID=227 RepID=UPI00311FC024